MSDLKTPEQEVDRLFGMAEKDWFVGERVRAVFRKEMVTGEQRTWVVEGKCFKFDSDEIAIFNEQRGGLQLFKRKNLIDAEVTTKVREAQGGSFQ